MSRVQNYKIVDKRCDYKASESRLYQTGPSYVNMVTIANTNNDATNPRFVITAPSLNTGVSRFMRIRAKGTITVELNGEATAETIFALRSYPISSVTQTITTVVNNTTITTNDVFRQKNAVTAVNCPSVVLNSYASTCPTQPDIVVTNNKTSAAAGSGPFSLFLDGAQGDGVDAPRTYWLDSTCANTQKKVFTVSIDIIEPVFCPPFVGDDSYVEALAGINQIQINYVTRDLINMFSCNQKIKSAAWTTVNPYTLLTSYITADAKSMVERPLRYRYNCPRVDYSYSTSEPSRAVVANEYQTCNYVAPMRQLASIPRYIIIWATPKDNVLTPDKPDIVYPINSVNISFCEKSGLLSSCDSPQLYEIAKQSGLDAHYQQFIGSPQIQILPQAADDNKIVKLARLNAKPLVIDVAQFLSIPEGTAVGCRYQTQFSYQAQATVTTEETVGETPSVNFHTMIIYDQELVTEGGSAALIEGTASVDDIATAAIAPQQAQQAAAAIISRAGIYGGSFWDSLLNVGKSVLPAVGNIAGEMVGVPGLGSIASGLLGSGMGSNTGGARMTRGAMHKMQNA
jgi:hypothetical protein